jgi:hypothetical protein
MVDVYLSLYAVTNILANAPFPAALPLKICSVRNLFNRSEPLVELTSKKSLVPPERFAISLKAFSAREST